MIIEASSDILGRNLKHLRESKGMSLAEMADYKLEWLEQGQDFEIEERCYKNLGRYFPEEAEHIFEKLFI